MMDKYLKFCENKELEIGKIAIIKEENKKIILFPTKTNYSLPSKMEYIEKGLLKIKECYKEKGIESIAVVGGRSEKDIIYRKQLSVVCREVLITTDDGSMGKKGNVMVEVIPLLSSGKIDAVYCVGPERMMAAIAQAAKEHKVTCQISIERYMKCGIGVCGSCDINGKLACIDGPIMSGDDAAKLSEFGKRHRDASGILKDY
jgi:dihydroorotate dehydrogenase electron transfer subunit